MDLGTTDPETGGKLDGRAGSVRPDYRDIFRREFRHGMTPARDHPAQVLSLRRRQEMVRLHAARDVTKMCHDRTIRDLPLRKFIREAVCSRLAAADSDDSVSESSGRPPRPKPASVSLLDLRPEPFRESLAIALRQSRRPQPATHLTATRSGTEPSRLGAIPAEGDFEPLPAVPADALNYRHSYLSTPRSR